MNSEKFLGIQVERIECCFGDFCLKIQLAQKMHGE